MPIIGPAAMPAPRSPAREAAFRRAREVVLARARERAGTVGAPPLRSRRLDLGGRAWAVVEEAGSEEVGAEAVAASLEAIGRELAIRLCTG